MVKLSVATFAPMALLLSSSQVEARGNDYVFKAQVLNRGATITRQPTPVEASALLARAKVESFEAIVRCTVDDEGILTRCSAGPSASRQTQNVQRVARLLAERIRVDKDTKKRLENEPNKTVSILMRADDGRTAICPQQPCQSLLDGIPIPPPPSPPPPLPS